MSIPYSGTIKRSAGVISAISKQLKSVTLKPAKKIFVTFDPFHEKVTSTRYVTD
jgi:large subunit ribosomal protein L53